MIRIILGAIFIFSGTLALFTGENLWYSIVDFAIGYLLLQDKSKEE